MIGSVEAIQSCRDAVTRLQDATSKWKRSVRAVAERELGEGDVMAIRAALQREAAVGGGGRR